MRFETKVQGIHRKGSPQVYVTVPAALAQAVGLEKGQSVVWLLGKDSQLVLRRLPPQTPAPQPRTPTRLLDCLLTLIGSCQAAFPQPEQFFRSARHLLSQLVCLGRHTITALLCCQNRQDQDWSGDYRHYARGQAHPEAFFEVSRQKVWEHLAPQEPLVVGVDDTLLRKSGRKIYGARYLRDPLSPVFHPNLVRGQRAVQFSAAWTYGEGQARMIPIDFCLAPLPAKPPRNADAKTQEAYANARDQANINRVAGRRLQALYPERWRQEAAAHPLVVVADNRFTNRTVFKGLPAGVTLIGRIRSDSALYYLPEPPPQTQKKKGRQRRYGERAPTPQELLQDKSVGWTQVKVHWAGRRLSVKCKRLAPVVSRLNAGQKPIQVVAVAPLRYRAPSGKEICREPAYLLCSNPKLSLRKLLQYYFWRWDLEVNFRDEKTLLGVGQAQVRRPTSAEQAPALAVAAYALLLLASIDAYGPQGQPEDIPLPKWRQRKPPGRATTNRLINQLRLELWSQAIQKEPFADFTTRPASEPQPEALAPELCSSLFQATG